MKFSPLRSQLLQQAISGKLTAQLDSEPEVAQLGSAPAPDEVPFAIPPKWKWVQAQFLGNWKAGATPPRSEPSFWENGTIPWLKSGEIVDGLISSVEEAVTEKAVQEKNLRVNPVGTFVVAMYGATAGKVGILQTACASNQACCACLLDDGLVSNWFLFYAFIAVRNILLIQAAGSAQSNLSKEKIEKTWIPLPPLEEQRRIVALIDELMSTLDRIEEAYGEFEGPMTEHFRNSALQQAMQGQLVPQLDTEPEVAQLGPAPANDEVPFELPPKWKWVQLGQVFSMAAGKYIKANLIKEREKYPCYGGNGLRGYTDCFNVSGTYNLIGRQGALCGNVHLVSGEFYATEHAVVARHDAALIDPKCAFFFLTALNLNQYATATAQPGLAVSKIAKVFYPLPPLEEQQRIANKLKELFTGVEQLKSLVEFA